MTIGDFHKVLNFDRLLLKLKSQIEPRATILIVFGAHIDILVIIKMKIFLFIKHS